MRCRDIEIGKYYMVQIWVTPERKEIGKLIGSYRTDAHMSYLFEFKEKHRYFHNGYDYVDVVGKDDHCWYVLSYSVLNEVPYNEVLAHEL